MNLIFQKPDTLGAIASGLCLIHCIATPFLFMANACAASCCSASPTWWQWMDYGFLLISFFAVWQSARTTSISYMKVALWATFLVLSFLLLCEKFGWLMIDEVWTYLAAISLATLHIYNLKYCQCQTDECCAHGE